jgi:hypothetical protein
MHNRPTLSRLLFSLTATSLLFSTIGFAQAKPATPPAAAAPAAAAQAAAPAPNEQDVATEQRELIRLLRLSPTLTTVVSHDPSLLSNQEYVARNNPQLAAFLAAHPEVARNPDFYLFSHLRHEDGQPDEALERAVWPDVYRSQGTPSPFGEFMRDLSPLLAFACALVAILWLTRVFVENRRWARIFKLQSDVHGRLIDKFTTNQELSLYMETEAGKRFLEAAPIPVNFEPSQRVPNAVARVLTPLQIGIVLVLLGVGLLSMRHASSEMNIPMLFFGMVTLMPGVGFIISAGITWLLAARLGLMPDSAAAREHSDPPYSSSPVSKDRP